MANFQDGKQSNYGVHCRTTKSKNILKIQEKYICHLGDVLVHFRLPGLKQCALASGYMYKNVFVSLFNMQILNFTDFYS